MPTKLGFQLQAGSTSPDALTRLKTMQPATLLVYDNVRLLNAAYDAIGPNPIYIFRQRALDDPQAYIAAKGGVEAAVAHFLNDIEAAAKAIPWAYHSSFRAATLTEDLAQFEALAVERAHEKLGIRLCIGNFATGQPTDWQVYRPALEAAVRYNAVVGLRESYPILPYVGYGPNTNIPNKNSTAMHRLMNELPYPQGYKDPALLVGHYRYLRDYCRHEELPVQLVITEAGAGRVLTDWLSAFGNNLGGWRSLIPVWQNFGFTDPEVQYFQHLMWLDQHVYRDDPEVIGMCIYVWNEIAPSNYEIGNAPRLLDMLQNYMVDARRDQKPLYQVQQLNPPEQFKVTVPRLRFRPIPSFNSKYTGGIEYGSTITATQYTFYDGFLWLRHNQGWSAYAPLENGNPEYDEKYLEGRLITTPRQDAAVNNFVATISEVKSFLQAHKGQMFYIRINPGVTPDGARRFSITTFPVDQGRRLLDQLHPEPGNPRMSPEAKKQLRDAGQL